MTDCTIVYWNSNDSEAQNKSMNEGCSGLEQSLEGSFVYISEVVNSENELTLCSANSN